MCNSFIVHTITLYLDYAYTHYHIISTSNHIIVYYVIGILYLERLGLSPPRSSASTDGAPGRASSRSAPSMYVCVYVCVYIYIYIHTCICMYIYIYIYTHTYVSMHTYNYMC